MVKTLQSILDKVPPATVENPALKQEKSKDSQSNPVDSERLEKTSTYRIVAEVPRSVKIQMRERLFRNPDETERTILLKALRAIGFSIEDEHLIDQRKIRTKGA